MTPVRHLLLACVLLACAGRASAEVVIRIPNVVAPGLRQQEMPGGVQPGRAAAREAVPPGATRFSWDSYETVVVVGEGTGVARPAWVLTYDGSGAFIVGYRARAFRAEDGLLHIDARDAIDAGPMADQWIPDSFAFGADDAVFTLDDQGHGHEGTIVERVAPEDAAYQRLLLLAQILVSGVI